MRARVPDSTARDRPSPYGERETVLQTVARGPVPRDRWIVQGMAMACPSPYGERETVLQTVARGPVPRDRSICAKTARQPKPFSVPIEAWRGPVPRPTVKGAVLGSVARVPCLVRKNKHFDRTVRISSSSNSERFANIIKSKPMRYQRTRVEFPSGE